MATVTVLQRAEEIGYVDGRSFLKEPVPVDPNSAAPSRLNAFVVSTDPKITVVPHFFSDAECDHLINLVEGCWMPSMVGQGSQKQYQANNMTNALSKTRTSWSCMTRPAQTSILERLEHRLAQIAGLPIGQLERLNMVRYVPGETFNEHHDGKFRPRTCFVYLNDLPEDEEGGDTFFPYLGLSFKAQKGTMVMWSNSQADGTEDSRMVHAGMPPTKGVKYGVNCFFNEQVMRRGWADVPDVPLEDSVTVVLADLGADAPADGSLRAYVLSSEVKLVAIPGFLQKEEVEALLAHGDTASDGAREAIPEAFMLGTRTLHQFFGGQDDMVAAVEGRFCAVAGRLPSHLAALRMVKPGTGMGLCNRGCGSDSAYVCLSDQDEVFFPKLGLRLLLRAGEAIIWPNIQWGDDDRQVEDWRTMRVHLNPDAIGLDAFWHDNPLREQQAMRQYVPDTGPPSYLPLYPKDYAGSAS
eukprot:TRINITY_DN13911_c0_g1_i1.p1 TRINITY_DN13911_c0_g1~~TRINITY_DN13911_c0_g1_i1.p1  ORF type:complete len:467 (+),score=91.33 TRINITY_DN13911_c0_g1_i1:84-1484(+)